MVTEDAGQEANEARTGEDEKETCFTIMPFGGWFDQYYVDIYKPAIEAAGLVPRRADDLYRPGTIVHDIWEYTQGAKVILADLTGKNPNVFYELGLGHALAKPVILVTESISDVPFDLRALRMIDYDKNQPDWGEVLKEKIRTSILEVLQAPLRAVLPAFLNVRDTEDDISVTTHEREILEIRQDLDLLRQEMARTEDRLLARPSLSSSSYPPETLARNPEQAKALVRAYLRNGLKPSAIAEDLTSRGVSNAWVVSAIDEELRQLRAEESIKGI